MVATRRREWPGGRDGRLWRMQTYITTSITWDDGEHGTEAMSPRGAAIEHALEGWMNADIEANPDAEDPPIGDRDPVEIKVVDPMNGDAETRWRVTWDREAGRAKAELL